MPRLEAGHRGFGRQAVQGGQPRIGRSSMPHVTTYSVLESSNITPVRIQPPDACPAIRPTPPLTDSEKRKHAENMADHELVRHVETSLRPVGKSLKHITPYLEEARSRFAHPGRRVPVPGLPSYTEWIHQTLGCSDRHVRRLLAAAKEPTDSSREDVLEQSPRQAKHDEAMRQACRLAHAVLGMEEPAECDPSGVQRKPALAAMAYQFLRAAHRKPISVIVRVKKLQQADVRGLCKIILMCLEVQVDQVFKTLADEDRREALCLFTQEIASRYDR